jgi:hypothetical protein
MHETAPWQVERNWPVDSAKLGSESLRSEKADAARSLGKKVPGYPAGNKSKSLDTGRWFSHRLVPDAGTRLEKPATCVKAKLSLPVAQPRKLEQLPLRFHSPPTHNNQHHDRVIKGEAAYDGRPILDLASHFSKGVALKQAQLVSCALVYAGGGP